MAITRQFVKAKTAEARRRAQQNARAGGRPRPNDADQAEPVSWLVNGLGISPRQLADYGGWHGSVKRYEQVLKWARDNAPSEEVLTEGATPWELVEPRFRWMVARNADGTYMQPTADMFEAFYNEFADDRVKPLLQSHKQWVADFLASDNLMINIPPRHGKTQIFSQWLPLWLIVMERNIEIILVSKSSHQAEMNAAYILRHLEANAALIEAYGRFAPETQGETTWKAASGKFSVVGRDRLAQSAAGTVESRGRGGQILGMQCDVMIIDDLTDRETAVSEKDSETEIEKVQGDMLSRLMIGREDEIPVANKAVVVGQRVHWNDLYGRLAEQKEEVGPEPDARLWDIIEYPAVLRWPDEDPDQPEPLTLWPEFWTFERLMKVRARTGATKFETMYQQRPLPPGGEWLRPEDWLRCRDADRPAGKGVRPEDGAGILPIVRVISLDPSPEQYHGIVVADVLYDRSQFYCMVLEVRSFQRQNPHILISEDIGGLVKQYHPDYFIVEQVAAQRWLKYDPNLIAMQELYGFQTIPHNTTKNKHDPDWGVISLSSDIAEGRVRMPYGDQVGRDMSAILEAEALMWSPEQAKAVRNDTLMALWFMKANFRKMRPLKSMGFQIEGGRRAHRAGRRPENRTKDFIRNLQEEMRRGRRAG